MKKTCEKCNKSFCKPSTRSSWKSWSARKFCSQDCYNNGRINSKETQIKRSKSLKLHYRLNPGRAQKHSANMKSLHSLGCSFAHGKHWIKTEEQLKNKMGVLNPAWKGGITPIHAKIRNSTKYADWRIAVFQRDNYTCQECGSKGVYLNADHIKPFAYYPELRLAIDNGRTLCVPCHRKTDTYAGRAKRGNNLFVTDAG